MLCIVTRSNTVKSFYIIIGLNTAYSEVLIYFWRKSDNNRVKFHYPDKPFLTISAIEKILESWKNSIMEIKNHSIGYKLGFM